MLHGRRDLDAAKVGATKADAEITGGRFEGEGDFVALMKADSCAGDRPSQRPLYVHQALWPIAEIASLAITVPSSSQILCTPQLVPGVKVTALTNTAGR